MKKSHNCYGPVATEADSPSQGSLFPQPLANEHLITKRSVYPIDYADRSLFGMDDAAHEDLELLKSYSVARHDCREFFDESNPFLILKAPKGTGKTTLCRVFEDELSKRPGHISLLRYDAEVSPSLASSASLSDWIRAWKANIANQVLVSLASDVTFATDPDMITTIERLEKSGERSRNWIGLLREHFLVKGVKSSPSSADNFRYDEILKRVGQKDGSKIWLFLDEVDQYFTNDEISKLKVGSMLLAARDMSSQIRNLNIRVTIKPNVWAILREKIDSLANIKEFQLELSWSRDAIRRLLARRVESYLERHGIQRLDEKVFYESESAKEEWLIAQVFYAENFDLGKGNRPPHTILAVLGANRPRWILELCKTCVKRISIGKPKDAPWKLLTFQNLEASLDDFGKERIKDLSSEYQSQCMQIGKIIQRFHGAVSAFADMRHLTEFIQERITSVFDVSIAGAPDKATPKEVAELLHFVGFIDARKDDLALEIAAHITFDARPSLASSQQLDEHDDFMWVIHPIFRKTLFVNQPSNETVRQRKKAVADRKKEIRRRNS